MLTHDGLTRYQRRHEQTKRDQTHSWHKDAAVEHGHPLA
jgi:hypothetical protein